MKSIIFGALLAATVALGAVAVGGLGGHGWGVGPEDKDNSKKDTTLNTKAKSISKSGYDIEKISQKKIDELAKSLTKEESDVILAKGTERAFCGNLVDNHKDGVYVCRLCGLPLFKSDAKFDSGTGWPSFFQPFDKDHVTNIVDKSYGMVRTEILCTRCGGHLGHVFEDGPKPTGLRFCLNSVSLKFYEKSEKLPAESQPIKTETAYFAGGCFWGVEDRFEQLPGVVTAVSGYMGGHKKNPTYREVCNHDTGHAETVKIVYDPAKITYKDLLAKFFKFHDPTQVNRQGPDIGESYRSAIFAADKEQFEQAKTFIAEQQKTDKYKNRTIATQLVGPDDKGKIPEFYDAEDYHQDYHAKHGGHCALPEE